MIETSKRLDILQSLGVFRYVDAERAGIPKEALRQLILQGEITSLMRKGYYCHPDIDLDPDEEEFAIACKKFGEHAAIGGLTALNYYALVDQVPTQVWVLTPPHKTSASRLYRLQRTQLDLTIGIDEYPFYRIVSVERAVAEAFYWEKKIGVQTAVMAIKTALRDKHTTLKKIMAVASQLGIERKLEEYLPVIFVEAR